MRYSLRYASTVPFEGNTAKAFDLARAALSPLGFRISSRDASSLELIGPGMTSTRQSALLGASRIQVTRGERELLMKAELDGVQSMIRFVTFFPIGLSLFLCVLFVILFGAILNHRGSVLPAAGAAGATALPWLILGPLLARHVHGRTCRGIDALLNNMAYTGDAA